MDAGRGDFGGAPGPAAVGGDLDPGHGDVAGPGAALQPDGPRAQDPEYAGWQCRSEPLSRTQVFRKGAYLLDCVVRLAAANFPFSGAEQFEHTAKSVFTVTPATVKGATATLLTFHLGH
ncbi:hypothetical protein [Streptomyces sp. A30]|uniref:hypothetical protein n=1 Tax=Streptomyces sp. A30 TaxID=2789273 RepID=UPI0039814214